MLLWLKRIYVYCARSNSLLRYARFTSIFLLSNCVSYLRSHSPIRVHFHTYSKAFQPSSITTLTAPESSKTEENIERRENSAAPLGAVIPQLVPQSRIFSYTARACHVSPRKVITPRASIWRPPQLSRTHTCCVVCGQAQARGPFADTFSPVIRGLAWAPSSRSQLRNSRARGRSTYTSNENARERSPSLYSVLTRP